MLSFRAKNLVYYWDLIRCLVDRNIKVTYKRSALGMLWMLIKPLMRLFVYAFVFSQVLKTEVTSFASFVFIGLLFWNWFNDSISQATGIIIVNDNLVKQPNFPTMILPIVIVITEWIHLSVAIPILFIFLLWESVVLTPVVFLLPILMALQFLLILSISYFLAAINVSFRDTAHTTTVLLQMLMYLSGIFYEIDSLDVKYQQILNLNPMVGFLNCYRSIFLYGELPPLASLLYVLAWIVVLLPFGLWIFNKQSDRFVEQL